MIDKEKLKRRFSRNAKQYDNYAIVQKNMGNILIDNIKSNKHSIKNILEIGCGTGNVTRSLINYFPDARIAAIDIAQGMIEHAKSITQNERVTFICGDIEEMELDEKFDLIISNATFQWFNYLENTMEKLIRHLNEPGLFCFSTFGNKMFIELNDSFDKAKAALDISESVSSGQTFFSLNEIVNVCNDIINKNNLANIDINSSELFEHEYFDCCADFLYSLKKIGANKSQKENNTLHPGFIDKVIEIYDKDYIENGKVVATYHNLFVYIKKK